MREAGEEDRWREQMKATGKGERGRSGGKKGWRRWVGVNQVKKQVSEAAESEKGEGGKWGTRWLPHLYCFRKIVNEGRPWFYVRLRIILNNENSPGELWILRAWEVVFSTKMCDANYTGKPMFFSSAPEILSSTIINKIRKAYNWYLIMIYIDR